MFQLLLIFKRNVLHSAFNIYFCNVKIAFCAFSGLGGKRIIHLDEESPRILP